MAWGARQEDGVWRLCERRGRTIIHACSKILPDVEIRFPGRSRAEECAHALNDSHWPAYERQRKKHPDDPMPFAWQMLEVIRNHQGLSSADFNRLLDAAKGTNQ